MTFPKQNIKHIFGQGWRMEILTEFIDWLSTCDICKWFLHINLINPATGDQIIISIQLGPSQHQSGGSQENHVSVKTVLIARNY